jgi:anti-sigma factor RsiW
VTGPTAPGRGDHLGDRLSGLIDGELDEAEAEDARRHLAGCPGCSGELQAVTEARSWLRQLPAVEPPVELRQRLLAADPSLVASHGRVLVVPLRGRRAAVAAVAGLAAAAAAVLGLLPAPDPPAEPQVTRLVEAHATAGQGTDPLSRLVPVGVPVSFGR